MILSLLEIPALSSVFICLVVLMGGSPRVFSIACSSCSAASGFSSGV